MKKKLLIILSVLVIVLSFIGVFFLGKYFGNTKQTQCNAEVINPVDQDGNSESQGTNIEEQEGGFTFNSVELENIIDIIPEKEKLTNPENEMTNQEKLITSLYLTSLNTQSWNFLEHSTHKGVDLKNILVKYFGSDLNVKLEGLECECGKNIYIYDSKTDTYNLNQEHYGHGAFISFDTRNYIQSYEIVGKVLKVKVEKVYYHYGADVAPASGYYLSYNDAVNNKNLKKMSGGTSFEYEENGMDYYEEVYKLEKGNLPVYVYTFEKVGDNFIFKGYELSK